MSTPDSNKFVKDFTVIQKLLPRYEDREIPYYLYKDLEKVFGPEYESFQRWMFGQGSYMDGVYADDVSNYFYRRDRNQLNGLPHGF